MSASLLTKIELGLEEFSSVRDQLSTLISRPDGAPVGVVETAAACAMLHSFYTEIEKILKLIARDFDQRMPSSEAWHKDLLNQMAAATDARPAVITADLVEVLSEYLAFRHLFRGASIVLMRWEKLSPLLAKIDETYSETRLQILSFVQWIRARATPLE